MQTSSKYLMSAALAVMPGWRLERLELGRRDAHGVVQSPGLEVLGHRVGVLVDLHHELVDGGLALDPVVRVLDHLHVLALLDLGRLEGPGADDRRLVDVGRGQAGHRHLGPDVLGQDRDPETQHVGLGLGADHLHREVALRHDLDDVVGVAGEGREVVLDDEVVGERDVRRREGLAVLPLDALPELEGPRLAVRRGGPACRQLGPRREVRRVADEEVVVEMEDLVGRAAVPDERVEVVGVERRAEAQRERRRRGRRRTAGAVERRRGAVARRHRGADAPHEPGCRQERGQDDGRAQATTSALGGMVHASPLFARTRARRRPGGAHEAALTSEMLHPSVAPA